MKKEPAVKGWFVSHSERWRRLADDANVKERPPNGATMRHAPSVKRALVLALRELQSYSSVDAKCKLAIHTHPRLPFNADKVLDIEAWQRRVFLDAVYPKVARG